MVFLFVSGFPQGFLLLTSQEVFIATLTPALFIKDPSYIY